MLAERFSGRRCAPLTALRAAAAAAAGIEHRGPVLDLVPIGDYTAKGVYMAKAWKVRGMAAQGGARCAWVKKQLPEAPTHNLQLRHGHQGLAACMAVCCSTVPCHSRTE
jgi:hypothetical protein